MKHFTRGQRLRDGVAEQRNVAGFGVLLGEWRQDSLLRARQWVAGREEGYAHLEAALEDQRGW